MATYLSVRAAAELCGVPEDVVQGWIDEGRLGVVGTGEAVFIPRSELEKIRAPGGAATDAADPPRPATHSTNARPG